MPRAVSAVSVWTTEDCTRSRTAAAKVSTSSDAVVRTSGALGAVDPRHGELAQLAVPPAVLDGVPGEAVADAGGVGDEQGAGRHHGPGAVGQLGDGEGVVSA